MSMELSVKFKIALCALILGFTISAPAMAVDVNYTDNEQADLQLTPQWYLYPNSPSLLPGDTGNPEASGNNVTVNYTAGGTIFAPFYVFGGLSNSGNANDNVIELSNGNVLYDVYGAFLGMESTGDASGNNVTMSGGSVGGGVFGALLNGGSGNANENTVEISDGSVNGTVYGAYLQAGATGNANGNTVTITGGTVTKSVVGAYLDQRASGNASNNTINIGGNATVRNMVVGGWVWYDDYNTPPIYSEAKNNTIHIYGMANLDGVSLFGNLSKSWATDGNTLIIDDYQGGSTFNMVSNFQNYRFIIGEAVTDTEAALKAYSTVGLTGVSVKITGFTKDLAAGTELMLIDNTDNGALTSYYDVLSVKGIAEGYLLEYYYDNNALMARILSAGVNPQIKSLSEGFLAGAVFLNQKNDLISNWGLPAMGQALKNHPNARFVPFVAMQGGGFTYKSGSSINVKGFSGLAGLAFGANETLSLGVFFEGGWGNYNTRNSFNNVPNVNGDGGTKYYGGGVMARKNNIWQGLYAQGAFSMGRSEVDFGTNDIISEDMQKSQYSSSSTYYSAHAGLGYLLTLSENAEADLYARYLWNRTGRDNVTVNNGPVKFKAVDSHRLQLGARAHYDLVPGFIPYAGALWEYEFGGEAKGRMYDVNIDAPSVRGASGMGELGFTLRPDLDAPLYIEAGVQGYIGKREGVTGTLRVSLAF